MKPTHICKAPPPQFWKAGLRARKPFSEQRAFLSVWLSRIGAGGLFCLFLALPAHAESTDLPNFHQTAPSIWRGAAPTDAGLKQLKAMGVKTIVDLRIAPKTVKKEGITARAMGFNFINLPMGSDPPTPKEVATLLATLKQAPQSPVYVHCQHGADRTGCMIGIYRVTQQGWTFPQAYAEMRRDGFNPRWVKLREAVQERAK